ncbi:MULTISPECIES: RICIN domain-containing protein [unclassified Streptomyces]|uniref:RICIN domain-containing protein n=1 Tax=unclassified Streptomyces TaxID=2593676 RepID=UPI0037F202B7|nr:RICIN domain-containing protein [Streptomyces sp. NBC_01176]
MIRSAVRALATAPAVLAMAATAVVAAGGSASAAANPGPGFPAHYAAPYVETWNSPSAMTNARNATGLKYFTLAFVIDGGGCNAMFNGDTPVTDAGWTSAINSLRGAGGDVIASFGGASGTEEAQACTSVTSLKAQYKKVIDTLNLTRVDFDIEGGAIADTAANDRRNKALAQLQQEYAAAGRKLDVQYTLPAMPNGLDGNGTKLLSNAKSNGLNVNLVNIMTMDYYDGTRDMGKAATDAAGALRTQLGAIWPEKSDAQLWAMEGNTPMIGVNDDVSEIFTTGNATTLANFAKSKGIQELAFWALGRDKACATNGQLSDTCSGTPQSAWQFSSTFNTVTGGTTPPPPTGSTGQITGLGGKCVDVASASSANGTAVQMYDCNGTTAQQWTVGSDNTVRSLGKCMDLTAAGTANGTKVQLYDCNGTGAQVWQRGSGDTLVNPVSGKCLDVTDKSTANGARLQIWTCAGGTNQQFHLPA